LAIRVAPTKKERAVRLSPTLDLQARGRIWKCAAQTFLLALQDGATPDHARRIMVEETTEYARLLTRFKELN
jgi:hypothetical protein